LNLNEIDESDSHSEKHDDPTTSTLRGISIDSSNEDENVSGVIRVNFVCNSNEIDLIVLQWDQHFAAETAIDPGIHRRGKQPFIGPKSKTFSIEPL
jgi:hypothetical protein